MTLKDAGPTLFDDITEVIELPRIRFQHLADLREICRTVELGSQQLSNAVVADTSDLGSGGARSGFLHGWLRQSPRTNDLRAKSDSIGILDLFCGAGGLSLGAAEASRLFGVNPNVVAGFDSDETALSVYGRNFPSAKPCSDPIESVFCGSPGAKQTSEEKRFLSTVNQVDLLIAGPPCQGHSDLNNHTRRDDPKNRLYMTCARAAEVLEPSAVIIENVPGARHDRTRVVRDTALELERLGYYVTCAVLTAADFGVPQGRKRFFMLATRKPVGNLESAVNSARVSTPHSLRWAIEDLADLEGESTFQTSANHSPVNRERIAYLFKHDLFDLPDSERPDCHRLKPHSYRAVYGRMSWDSPAPTITCGFGSTGQGRFVHPARRRTLTPHEAARVQSFPDWFDFGELGRVAYQSVIGNAVPPLLAQAVCIPAIAAVLSRDT